MANLQIVISALNKASGDLNKVKKDIEGLGTAGKSTEGGLKGLGDGLSAVWSVGLSAAAAVAAAAGAVKLLTDAAQEGAAFQRMEEASGSLAESIGTDMDDILSSLQGASLGMVSDFDLMQSASRAMMLGVSADAGELSQLMEVAALRGRAMGLPTTQAFNDIVTGIGRASPLILDNLGIVVDAEARYKAYADSVGKTSEELSKAEKTQALLNGVLESSKGLLEATGGLTVDNAGKWEQLSAAQKNYFDMVKVDIADATSWWAEYWTAVFNEKADVKKSREVWEQARDMMLITADMQAAYDAAVRGAQSDYTFFLDNVEMIAMLEERIKTVTDGTQNWADANYEGAGASAAAQAALIAQSEAADENAVSMKSVADATNNADAAMRSYSESLLFKIASEGLSQESAYNLAIAMGLVDKNTVAATEQVNAYKQMLDNGSITQAQYNRLVADLADDIENLPEGKNLEVTTNAEDISAKLEDLEERNFEPKGMDVVLEVDDSAVRSWSAPTKTGTVSYIPSTGMNQAVGGAVYGGNPYTWQEYGYKGELFVPSSDGFVLSRADAERALSRALTGGGSALDPETIGKAVARALSGVTSGKSGGGNVYNLTMPTSSNPADVRTAFELMEAWGA